VSQKVGWNLLNIDKWRECEIPLTYLVVSVSVLVSNSSVSVDVVVDVVIHCNLIAVNVQMSSE